MVDLQLLPTFPPAKSSQAAAQLGPLAAARRADPARSLVAIAVIAPFPAASNFPAAWLMWSALIGLVWLRAPEQLTGHYLDKTHLRLLWLPLLFAAFALLQAAAGILPVDLRYLPAPSVAPTATLLAALRIIGLALILQMLFSQRRDEDRYITFALWLFWGIVAHACFALVRLYIYKDLPALPAPDRYFGVTLGGFVAPNSLAMQLGFGLILGLAFLPSWTGKDRYVLLLALIILALALVATQSRLGILSTFVGAAVVSVLVAGSRRSAAISLTAIVSLGAVGLVFGPVRARLAELPNALEARLALYRQVMELIAQNWASGVGIDAFALAFPAVHRPPVTAGFVWGNAHSSYLTLWAEAGVLAGSLPLLAAVFAITGLSGRLAKLARGPERALPAAALAALIQSGLHSGFDFAPEVYANTLTLTLLVGFALAPARTSNTRRKPWT